MQGQRISSLDKGILQMQKQNNFKIKPIISLFLLLIGIFTIITMLGKILIPFVVALILTYIIHPFVEKIHKKLKIKLSIITAIISIAILLILICIPIFVIPALILQIKNIVTDIPSILIFVNNIFHTINTKYGTNINVDPNNIKILMTQNINYLYTNMVSPIAKNSLIVIEILAYLLLIPFVMFYTILNWENIIKFFKELIPKSHLNITLQFINDIDKMLSSYLRGQVSVIFVLVIYYTIALNVIHLSGATLVGLLTGILVFIPYVGIFIGFATAMAIGVSHFSNIHQLVYILIIFVIGHSIESWIVTPFLVGGKIGLNPIMIILALMIFGKLFGIVGLLLALPLATITTVLLRYLKVYYFNSNYYNET